MKAITPTNNMFVIIFTVLFGAFLIALLQLCSKKTTKPAMKAKENALAPCAPPVDAEEEVLDEHAKEMQAINNGNIPSYAIVDLFSPRLRDEDAKIRAEQNRLKFPQPPYSGIILVNTPSMKRWNLEMESRSSAMIGSVFQWISCITGVRNQLVDYMLVRVNGTHRWIHLKVTHYVDESIEETVAEYLRGLDTKLFAELPTAKVLSTCRMWNHTTKAFSV
jgi:hypothetical protein